MQKSSRGERLPIFLLAEWQASYPRRATPQGWQSTELEGAWIFWSIYGIAIELLIPGFLCAIIKFYMFKSLLIWGFHYTDKLQFNIISPNWSLESDLPTVGVRRRTANAGLIPKSILVTTGFFQMIISSNQIHTHVIIWGLRMITVPRQNNKNLGVRVLLTLPPEARVICFMHFT